MYRVFLGIIIIFIFISCKNKEAAHTVVTENNNPENEIELKNTDSGYIDFIRGYYYSFPESMETSLSGYLLNLFEGSYTSNNLQGIEHLIDAKKLSVYIDKNIDEIDFSLLEKLPELKGLSLRIDGAVKIPDLSRIKNLEVLYFTQLPVDSFKDIDKKIPKSVTTLILHNNTINMRKNNIDNLKHIEDIAELSKLVNLEALQLCDIAFNFSDLSGLTKLKYLDSHNFIKDGKVIDFIGIEKLTELKYLEIIGRGTGVANIDMLSNVQNLKKLILSYDGEITYNFIKELTQLNELYLTLNDNLDFFDLNLFNSFQYIREIFLFNESSIKKNVDIADLGNLENLSQLGFSNDGFIIKNMDKINNLTSLKMVYIPNCDYYPKNTLELIRDDIYVDLEPSKDDH